MMKCTMLFGYASNAAGASVVTRTAGWSESIYQVGTSIPTVRAQFEVLCRKRAALLPDKCALIGQRYQIVNPVGASQSFDTQFPGSGLRPADIPQMALLVKLIGSATRNTRAMMLRAIPDAMVIDGEYVPDSNYRSLVTVLMNELSGGAWSFRARDLGQPQFPILSIAQTGTDGIVTAEVDVPYVVGDFVRILKTRNVGDRAVGGRFRVSAATGGNVFTLQNFTLGNTTKGQVRKDLVIYPNVGSATPVRISTHKVGRPFNAYRGRRSKR